MVKSRDSKVPPRLRLAPEWQPRRDASKNGAFDLMGSRLWSFIEKIASSRREGKNRRDGATVSTRVVRLADTLGRRLFEEAIQGGSAAKGKGKGKGGQAVGFPTLSSEDAMALKKSVSEGKRRRTLEKRAKL